MVAVYGSVAPSRFTLTLTWVPLGPRSSSATAAESMVAGVLAVDRDNHIAAPHPGIPGRRVDERLHHHRMLLVHRDLHADAVILRVLPALHLPILGRIHEIRVRIERVKHAGNRAAAPWSP